MPEIQVLNYFHQLVLALEELHKKNIIHRDLKAANIFLTDNSQRVLLGDMNVSKINKQDFARTQTGTPYYASPEVWREDPYNCKTDIWSLGCVIYELCMLHPPFQAKNLEELCIKVQEKKISPFDNFYS
jgi:NIMA (never in mitosis gene a)-related kinase